MKMIMLKQSSDEKSFKIFEVLGFEIEKIDDLENTDAKLRKLVKQEYTTIVVTNEVAGFSENIIKKYNKNEAVNIIIVPAKR